MTRKQQQAMDEVPWCVDTEDLDDDGTWGHLVFRVEHPVAVWMEGESSYSDEEVRACVRWLRKYARSSNYASCRV